MKRQDELISEAENKRLYHLGANEQPSERLDQEILNQALQHLNSAAEPADNDIAAGTAAQSTEKNMQRSAEIGASNASDRDGLTRQLRRYRWPLSTAASVLLVSGLLVFSGEYRNFYDFEMAQMLSAPSTTTLPSVAEDASDVAMTVDTSADEVAQKALEARDLQRKIIDERQGKVYKAKVANVQKKAAEAAMSDIVVAGSSKLAPAADNQHLKPMPRQSSAQYAGQIKALIQPMVDSVPVTEQLLALSKNKTFTAGELAQIQAAISAKTIDVEMSLLLTQALIDANELTSAKLLYHYVQDNYPQLRTPTHEDFLRSQQLQKLLEKVNE